MSRAKHGLSVVKRKKAAPEDPPLPSSKVLQTKNIRPSQMAVYLEKVLAAYAPHLVPTLLQQVHAGIARREKESMRLGAEIFGLAQKGGVIINNVNENTNVVSAEAGSIGFDAVIRNLSAPKIIDVAPK
jgi:hypothetical protein